MTEPASPPVRDPLAEAATRPLAQEPAAREDAAAAFSQILRTKGDPAKPATRWEEADRSPPARHGPRIWTGLCLLLSLLLIASSWRDLRDDFLAHAFIYNFLEDPDWLASAVRPKHPSPLIPHPSLGTLENSERLWLSDPERPAYFAEHVAARLEHERFSEQMAAEILETGARIDPDNAFFPLAVAARIARDAATGNRGSGRRSTGDNPFTIQDPGKLAEALDLAERATRLARHQSYSDELAQERLRLFPVSNRLDNMHGLIAVAEVPMVSSRPRDLMISLGAEARRAGEEGDLEAFLRVEGIATRWVELLLSSPDEGLLINELVHAAVFTQLGQQLQLAAEALALEEPAEVWGGIHQRLADRQERRSQSQPDPDLWERYPSMTLGLLGPAMLSRQVIEPPPVTEADLRTVHDAEKSFAIALLSSILGLLLALTMLALAAASRLQDPPARFLGERLRLLLRWNDHARILALGLLAPLLLVGLLAALGRQQGDPRLVLLLPGLWLIAAVLIPIWTAAAAGWRLRRRAEPLLFPRPQKEILLVVSAILPGSLVALAFLLVQGRPEQEFQWAAIGLLCAAAVALLLPAGLALMGDGPHSILRAALCRACLPALATAVLLAAGAVPVFLERSNQAFLSDRLFRIDPEQPSLSAYEYQVALQLRRELRETYHGSPEP